MSIDIDQALRLPRAHGTAVGRGEIRRSPEDFFVREWLGFEADGDGDHWLLKVRKRGANTHWVAGQLGKLAGIQPRDVGYAGLKDRNAVTEQSFTVPGRTKVGADWLGVSGEGFEVIDAQRHRRKLKRGALKGNDFEIVIRDFVGDTSRLTQRIDAVGRTGVPNFFGPQRFGHELNNLRTAIRMFSGERIHDRHVRGFALSAARALLFNAVLARRVQDRTWNALQAGDVANLDGTNSIFAVGEVDATLAERCELLDVHPTGPLWGRGDLKSAGTTRELEASVAAENAALAEGLARVDMEQERRSLRLRVQSLSHTLDEGTLTLRFRLSRGAFATTVLHEILENAFDSVTPETED